MADAILTQTPVRGVSALAERPDGTRLNFVPFLTPLFDAQGRLWVLFIPRYPQILPGQDAIDYIAVLEDTQGKGRADKSHIFVSGLRVATGMVPDGVSEVEFIGEGQPKFNYGLGNTFIIKGVRLYGLVRGQVGGQLYNVFKQNTMATSDWSRISRHTSKPLIPGRLTSSSTSSGRSFRMISRASSPVRASITEYPLLERVVRITRRI